MERRCTNYVRNNDLVPRLPGNVGFIQKMWDRVPFAVRMLLDLGAAPLPLDLGDLVEARYGPRRLCSALHNASLDPRWWLRKYRPATAAKRILETHRPRDPSVSDTYLGVMEWNGFMAAQNEHRAKAYVQHGIQGYGGEGLCPWPS